MSSYLADLPEKAAARLDELGMTLEAYLTRLAQNYVFFVEEIWHDRDLEKFAPLSDVERDMCNFAAGDPHPQTGKPRLPNRRVLLAPRGIGKTHMAPAPLACWDQYRRPGEAFNLIPSKSEKTAKATLSLIRQW